MNEPKRLACMASHYDGAHCGLTDWYPEIKAGIQKSMRSGSKARWTTGWYSSKKEIASACISHDAKGIHVEVSVSDDFDTEGRGTIDIPHTTSLDKLEAAVAKAWSQAKENQNDNRLYTGFSIHDKRGRYVETLILPMGDGWDFGKPPGDCYHAWGFQNENTRIPKTVKAKLRSWANQWGFGHEDPSFTVKSWTIKPWSNHLTSKRSQD